jgi:putative transposase
MAVENVTRGEVRIANELLLKLGIGVSPRTVRKYMPARTVDGPDGWRTDQRWMTFVRNHAESAVACDFFTVVTFLLRDRDATFPVSSMNLSEDCACEF